MFEFHHKYFKRQYDARLLLTDTDSLFYEIKTHDIYEDFYEDKSLFNFSDYPRYSKSFDLINKEVIDKMKDEFKGKLISDVFVLKSKMYSLVDVDREENKKAKGVNRSVVMGIKHKEFVHILFNKKPIRHRMELIRHRMERAQSKLHRIGTCIFLALMKKDAY